MTVRTGGTCTIEGCDKPMFGRTWCSKHYAVWRKYGDPLHAVRLYEAQSEECSDPDCDRKPKRRGMCEMHARRAGKYGETTDPRERLFWSKINKDGPVPEHRPDLGPCWIYTGYVDPESGYGQFGGKVGGVSNTRLPHRIAYEYLIGPVPKGLHVDHVCRNRACVNAANGHLEPVTPRENLERGDQGAFWGYVPEKLPAKVAPPKPTACAEDDGTCGSVYKRDLCVKHYKRWQRDPLREKVRPRPAEERFWQKVDKDGPIPEHKPELGACWLWTAAVNPGTGYGEFNPRHALKVGAHCYSYELANGTIAEGFEVHHECHARRCVRPDHLSAATRAENMAQRKVRR